MWVGRDAIYTFSDHKGDPTAPSSCTRSMTQSCFSVRPRQLTFYALSAAASVLNSLGSEATCGPTNDCATPHRLCLLSRDVQHLGPNRQIFLLFSCRKLKPGYSIPSVFQTKSENKTIYTLLVFHIPNI